VVGSCSDFLSQNESQLFGRLHYFSIRIFSQFDYFSYNQLKNSTVNAEPDEADNKIAGLVQAGYLVITANILLADRVISKDAHAFANQLNSFLAKQKK